MARVKIELPQKRLASIKLPVRITDINFGNHLGNDALVGMLHEARVQWLSSYHFSELNIEGIGLIMADLAVVYKNESYHGDQLTISIYAGDITNVSFELYYSVHNQDDKIIAQAKTGMVCFNYQVKKAVSIPTSLQRILE
jgi:acyl-CoA thioester hydrolase